MLFIDWRVHTDSSYLFSQEPPPGLSHFLSCTHWMLGLTWWISTRCIGQWDIHTYTRDIYTYISLALHTNEWMVLSIPCTKIYLVIAYHDGYLWQIVLKRTLQKVRFVNRIWKAFHGRLLEVAWRWKPRHGVTWFKFVCVINKLAGDNKNMGGTSGERNRMKFSM